MTCKNKEPSMVSITTSPAKAAHSKATLHVECCTKQSEPFPRTVDKTLSSLPFKGIYIDKAVRWISQMKLRGGSDNA